MIGQHVTLVRRKPELPTFPGGKGVTRTFTTQGVIVDMTKDAEGAVTGVRIRGVRVETGDERDSWFAVGPRALDGSSCTEQTATLDACGCPVTDQCGCDLREHTCGPGITYGCDRPDCDGDNGD